MDVYRSELQFKKLRAQHIAHEINLNPQVQIQEDTLEEFSIVIFGYTYQSYDFVMVEEELKAHTPRYTKMILVLKTIRATIHNIASVSTVRELKTLEAIDLESFYEKLEQGMLNMGHFCRLIESMYQIQLRLLQLPAREAQCQELLSSIQDKMRPVSMEAAVHKHPEAVSFALHKIYKICIYLRIDALNSEFHRASAFFSGHKGVEWERRNFYGRLEEGLNTTEKTEAMIGKAVESMVNKTPDVLKCFLEKRDDETAKIAHVMMMLDLLPKQNLLWNLPETLYLDQEKMFFFQKRILHFAAVTNICLRFKTNASLGYLYTKVLAVYSFFCMLLC
jgi:hypothetical protein